MDPKTKISICSSDTLELSVTKTCLDVLQDLGKAFSDAIRPEGLNKPEVIAPYIVENDTGFDITLNLKQGALFLHSSHLPQSDADDSHGVVFKSISGSSDVLPQEVTTCKISPGGKAYLQAKRMTVEHSISAFSSLNRSESDMNMFLHVQIGDIDKEVTLPVHKADRRYFPLYRDTKQEPWGIISHVKTEYGSTVISIHGVLKIQNHFSTPINVSRLRAGVMHEIGIVQPGAAFNVPLHALYAAHKDLHFSVAGYKTSVQGINWKEHPSDFKLTKYLQCDPAQTFEPFYITAIRERQEVYHEVTSKFTMLSACYIVHLRPPLFLRNALPIDIRVSVAGCTVANPGNKYILSIVIVFLILFYFFLDLNGGVEEATEATTEVAQKPAILSQQEDFLDYGEKVVKPGDILHLPTVKTTVKEGEQKSYIVARVI